LNLLLRSTDYEHIGPAEQGVIAQNATAIRQLIESELKRARLAGRGSVGQRFDVDAELPALIGLLQQVYSDKQVDVRYNIGPGVELVHDRQDMLELIGNLLDNAVKWCRSVVILNLRSAKGILIDVEDDGPGCTPAELGKLTGRGVRIDESVAGHGLGLSIVKDIVETYDGRLDLENSTRLGGLRASVYLPARSRDGG
jgi:signal transduction histidine kinase